MDPTVTIAALCVSIILMVFFGFYAIKFGIILLRIQDQIEESLDIIDEQYDKMTYILEIPLASDSPQVKEIVNAVRETRNAVLEVSHALVRHASEEEKKKIDKN